jgi:hypothetical protein
MMDINGTNIPLFVSSWCSFPYSDNNISYATFNIASPVTVCNEQEQFT